MQSYCSSRWRLARLCRLGAHPWRRIVWMYNLFSVSWTSSLRPLVLCLSGTQRQEKGIVRIDCKDKLAQAGNKGAQRSASAGWRTNVYLTPFLRCLIACNLLTCVDSTDVCCASLTRSKKRTRRWLIKLRPKENWLPRWNSKRKRPRICPVSSTMWSKRWQGRVAEIFLCDLFSFRF